MCVQRASLILVSVLGVLVLVSACAAPTPEVITEVETVEVERTVEVEKVVEVTPEPMTDPRVGGTLRIARNDDVRSLDMHRTSLGQDALIVGQWFVGTLIAMNVDDEYIPYLAESWDISEDGLVWTFNLRDDVKFHNGDPVTAHDWVWTFQRAQDPELAAPVSGQALKEAVVEALDDYVLRVTFPDANNFRMTGFTYGWLGVMSQRAVEEWGDEYPLHPVGTGPYRVTEVRPGEGLTLERWDEYNWGPEFFVGANTGPYFFDRVEFAIIPEMSTQIAAVESGDVDVVNTIVNPADAALLEEAGALVNSYVYGQVRMAYLNNGLAPFDDIRVRQAFNYAVNREEASLIVTDGAEPPCSGPICQGMMNYDPNVERTCGYTYDLDRARELMEEAGYTYGSDGMLRTPDNEPFEVTMIAESVGGALEYSEVLQAQWQALGVDVTIEATEPAILYSKLTDRDYTMGFAQRGGFASPDYLYTLFHSSTGGQLPGSFRSAVDNSQTDAYVERNRTLLGRELQESVNEMYCHIAEQAYSVWVSDRVMRDAVGSRIQDVVPFASPSYRYWIWSNAYIAADDR